MGAFAVAEDKDPPPPKRHDVSSEAQAQPAGKLRGERPNILILMCDEMRFPPVYESAQLAAFRARYLKTQNFLRARGASFQRHYAAAVSIRTTGRVSASIPCSRRTMSRP